MDVVKAAVKLMIILFCIGLAIGFGLGFKAGMVINDSAGTAGSPAAVIRV